MIMNCGGGGDTKHQEFYLSENVVHNKITQWFSKKRKLEPQICKFIS